MYVWQQEWRNPVYTRRINSSTFVFKSFITPILIYKFCLYRSLSWFIIKHSHRLYLTRARLMYLRVYDSRVSSHQPAPSPSLCYLVTHEHRTLPTPTFITFTCTQVLWFLESLTSPVVSFDETTRTMITICLPTQPSVGETFYILLFQSLVSYYTDTHFYILSLALALLL